MRGRAWQATDRTGGAVDAVLDDLRRHFPDLSVERLVVSRPGDDDNVYFLGVLPRRDLVQIDTAPAGRAPFIVEADQRVTTDDPAHAAAVARDLLIRSLAVAQHDPPETA